MPSQISIESMHGSVETAVSKLSQGGVIAYPAEHCFGLGCDPKNQDAIKRILKIKQRKSDQGLILIASSIQQIDEYVDVENSPMLNEIKKSWPGHVTWILDSREKTPNLISGNHSTIAIRQTEHPVVKQLCDLFGGAIVSTSANRHAQSVLKSAKQVQQALGAELDYILDAPIGDEPKPSNIRDGNSGEIIR